MNLCLDPHSTFSTEEKEVLFLLCFLASYNTFCILSFFLLLLFLLSPFLNQIVFSLLCFKSSSYILIIVLYLHVFCKYIFRTPPTPLPLSVAYLLLLLTLSFAGQRFFNDDKSQCQAVSVLQLFLLQ